MGLDQMSQSEAGFTVKPIKLYFHRLKMFIIEIFNPYAAFYIKGNTLPVKVKTYWWLKLNVSTYSLYY